MGQPRRSGFDLLAESRRERAARPQEDRPEAADWRADALAQSRHSRLDALARPPAVAEPAAAAALCARLCRQALGDFAPALLLLPRAERRRVQALAAYASTLFDFARQRGVEGERLAQINRWEFALEEALASDGASGSGASGQPVFLRMVEEEERRRWPREALDALAAAARERVTTGPPATAEEAAGRDRRLAHALAHALLGEEPPAAGVELGAVLLALVPLQELGEELRQKRWPLPPGEVAATVFPGERPAPASFLAAVPRAVAGLRGRLVGLAGNAPVAPPPWRRPARYLERAAAALLRRIEPAGPALLEAPPRLGIATRLRLLVGALC